MEIKLPVKFPTPPPGWAWMTLEDLQAKPQIIADVRHKVWVRGTTSALESGRVYFLRQEANPKITATLMRGTPSNQPDWKLIGTNAEEIADVRALVAFARRASKELPFHPLMSISGQTAKIAVEDIESEPTQPQPVREARVFVRLPRSGPIDDQPGVPITIWPAPTGLYVKNANDKHIHFVPGDAPLQKVASWVYQHAQYYGQNVWSPEDDDGPSAEHKRDDYPDYTDCYTYQTLCSALSHSEAWRCRGRMDPERKAPKDFWKLIPSGQLGLFDGHGYRKNYDLKTWWKSYLENNVFQWSNIGQADYWNFKPEIVRKAIEAHVLPEVPWSVRKFNRVSFDQLHDGIASGLVLSKNWAQYVSSGALMFHKTLRGHGFFEPFAMPQSLRGQYRDRVIEMLLHWPKSKAANDALNNACNAGMPFAAICALNPSGPAQLREYAEVWRQMTEQSRGSYSLAVNRNYMPPTVSPPVGWRWADHNTFYDLSETYNCCISNAHGYADAICNGVAHVLYKEDMKDGGSVAFVRWSPDGWMVQEQRSYGNAASSKEDRDAMKVFMRTFTTLAPGPHEPVAQVSQDQLFEDIAARLPDPERFREIYTAHTQGLDFSDDNDLSKSLENALRYVGVAFDRQALDWVACEPPREVLTDAQMARMRSPIGEIPF